jgi:hypothetical protein
MSTKSPRRLEDAGTDSSEEPHIEDVRYLEEGDRVRLNGREKPLTVTDAGARLQHTIIAERPIIQHLVELEGEWADAVTYVIANCVDPWQGIELPEQRSLTGGPMGSVTLTLVEMGGL